ncbi:acyl-CoA thioesterase [Christiangramia salexigens]|uniref:Thioesterase n=1 Tax=Christiangramia salexigens TaxID=1913577 RepID=A0A1L3J498_9FLAO|nr:acyl-CoA thioesterase [Christiangramia salexigens]APG59969.1 thioesterase [Christiangramia salexigens]
MHPDIFEKSIVVEAKHLDKQNHVNNVQYVQWVQDIAEEHWETKANKEQKSNYVWVVVRHEIDYKKEAVLNDKISLKTYVGETTHVTSVRHVIIKNEATNKLLVQAKTTWCLLDSITKKPAKISGELKDLFLS